MIKKNPRPRPCRNRPGAARSIRSRPDPIDPTPRARRSRARARTRREDGPPIERAKKQSDRVARRPLARVVASSRRRRAAVRQSRTRRPAKPRASSEGFKNSVSFHESPLVKPDTHSRFRLPGERPRARRGANVAGDGRRTTRRWSPTDRARTNGSARVVAVHRASVPLLLSLLGGRLDGDRRGSLDVRGRDDKHSICFFRARVCRRE